MHMEHKKAGRLFWCLLILFVVNVSQIVVYTLVHFCAGGRLKEENIWISLISAVINGGICLWIYGKLCRKKCIPAISRQEETLPAFGWYIGRWPVILAGGCAFCVVVTFVLTAIDTIFPQWFTSYNAVMENIDIRTSLVTIFYAVCIAPIAEECIFRGALLSVLAGEGGFWSANVVQALCFGVYHGNPVQGVYAFLMGMILGYVFRYGGGLPAAICFHVAFNGTTWLMERIIPADIVLNWQVFGVVISAGGLVCAWALWMLRRMYTGVDKK